MKRREFLATGLAATAAVAASSPLTASPAAASARKRRSTRRFHLNYAPHFGMFRHLAGREEIDQIKFMADQGFTAIEDHRLKSRTPEWQRRIRRELDRHDMTMGAFAATGDFGNPTFVSGDARVREAILADIREAVAVARRMNAQWCTVMPGPLDRRAPRQVQTANAIDTLKYCADLCERAGLVMLLEPLNRRAGHPRMFLQEIPQAYQICRAVGSPSCKLVFDVYQQQTLADNVLQAMDKAWSEIAYFQIGDSRGRKEPGTGDIDYVRIFQHLHQRDFTGIVGLDHGNSLPGAAGERAVIDAYAAHDDLAARATGRCALQV
jgi:hydroxypyruvate isomerase